MADRTVVIFAPPNGWGEDGKLDQFSRATLERAAIIYRHWKRQGAKVVFGIGRCIVRGPDDRLLWEAWREAAQWAGIHPEDIVVTKWENINCLTEGPAMAELARANPGARFEIVAVCGPPVASYQELAYRAGAWYKGGVDIDCEVSWPKTSVPDDRVRLLYLGVWIVTRLAALTKPSFLVWYLLRNWTDQWRLERFTRTVKPPKR